MSELTLTSSSFTDGSAIPRKHGYKNENLSPQLTIDNMPENTKSLALIMDDPDAMGAVGKVWVHWLLWNVDSTVNKISENSIPAGSTQGKTDFGEISYGGPAPPDKEHTYLFKLYALDTKLDLSEGASKSELEDAMQNHILGETVLKGTYAP